MTSPFTGGEVRLCEEPRSMTYRKEQYNYIHRHYQCVDTGMYFTDTELDTANLEQVHAQYRDKYGIPSPSEIAQTRKKYGLSASKISLVLGLGVNQYRLYEAGARKHQGRHRSRNRRNEAPEQRHPHQSL